MPTSIRKVLVPELGGVSNVIVVRDEISDPAPGEVQVKVLYSGFSGADINMRMGRYPLQKKAPLTPGYCFVGMVHYNGTQSSKFTPGDLVTAVTVYDSEAELVNVAEKHLQRVPAGMDAQQACALVLDWNTAYGMVMHAAEVREGQRVFVHGMSGAVGYAVMALCRLQGAEVYGTASQRNHAAIQELGATPFVYSNKDWMAAIKERGGADVVFDPLGFESWDESWSVLSSHGLLVGYGGNLASLNGDEARSVLGPTAKLFARNLMPCGRRTKFYYIARDQKTFAPDYQALLELHGEGKIRVPIKQVWDMDDIQDAHRGWTTATGMGSQLIRVSKEGEKGQ